MKAMRKFISFVLAAFVSLVAACAQTQIVGENFFPAELEFKELQKVQSEESFKRDGGALGRVKDGNLFKDVGFEQYSRRSYALGGKGSLTVEVIELKDTKAAYSLISLLRKSEIEPGPPGELQASDSGNVLFVRGEYLVRLTQTNSTGATDLPARVAVSVSNRIGQRKTALPGLISHFPKDGYDPSTLRYFLEPKSYGSFAAVRAQQLKFEPGMEIAEAQYTLNKQTGTLSLINFPTHEIAEGYQEELEKSDENRGSMYVKRAGPLVGVLVGSFDPSTADILLNSIHFSYAIKWIYDKNNSRSSGKTIWGVPMPILGTVVRSIVFVGILCGFSILAGVSFAFFRVWLRDYAPQNILDRPERTEMTRLKINEK
jgi:hypothetical protein